MKKTPERGAADTKAFGCCGLIAANFFHYSFGYILVDLVQRATDVQRHRGIFSMRREYTYVSLFLQ